MSRSDKFHVKAGIDYTLYNQIKAKFPVQPNTILFVSITSDNIDELVALPFEQGNFYEFRELVRQHWLQLTPYAAIGGVAEQKAHFFFACPEFVQEEDCETGEILESELGTYKNTEVDLNAVRADLKKLLALNPLSGNA